ncbi:hypothetical protein [Herbiconiux sp.]|uniref:hypothetical protein n=1 Tax=Herbiconiux sp. TaxID=1871186 RepID=UPI0025C5942C|nr:hypothetical protein [Herbiconiux sp.]
MQESVRRVGAKIVAVATVVTGAMLLSGCSAQVSGSGAAPTASVAPRTVYGFVIISDPQLTEQGVAERRQRVWDTGDSSCVAPAGFEDIVAGGELQVLGASGVIATGEIQVGDFHSDVMSANGILGCGFPFVVEGVPGNLDRYGVHVGAESREPYAFSASEMRSGPRLFLP